MELLILAIVAAVLVVTLFAALLKLLVALLFVPFKLLGSLLAGLGHLVWVPFKIAAIFLAVAVVLAGLLALPVAVPLVVVGGLLIALAC